MSSKYCDSSVKIVFLFGDILQTFFFFSTLCRNKLNCSACPSLYLESHHEYFKYNKHNIINTAWNSLNIKY